MSDSLSHCVTARIAVSPKDAFAFLADPLALGNWSLGCMRTAPTEHPGVYSGFSLFDGGQGFFSIRTHPELGLIDYLVGPAAGLVHRISARVMGGAGLGLGDDECLVSLIAWRPASMNEERWRRLIATHEAEIWLIKAQIEAGITSPMGRGRAAGAGEGL